MNISSSINNLLKNLRYFKKHLTCKTRNIWPIKAISKKISKFKTARAQMFPRGHFYSPIPSLSEIQACSRNIFMYNLDSIAGI